VTDRAPFAAALLDAIDALAARLGCAAIHTCLAASEEKVLDRFRGAGYAPRSVVLCKSVASAPMPCVAACIGQRPDAGLGPPVERSAPPR
jgi:hypothetical protein